MKLRATRLDNNSPLSVEISFIFDDPAKTIANIVKKYKPDALFVDETDGISLEFKNWRLNLRSSNTEPVIRLNVESKGDISLMNKITQILCPEIKEL